MDHPSPVGQRQRFLVPTLTKQSWYFILGGSLFALGSAASIWGIAGTAFSNWVCFAGAWFFTTAGLFQLVLSGEPTVPVGSGRGRALRAEWLAAASQSFGTLLFNVSTTAALTASSVNAEKHYIWTPDAGGSIAFLLSAGLGYVACYREQHTLWRPSSSTWWSAHINMIGCIAFAGSAVGSFVQNNGSSEDATLANWGTFIGAICFVLAAVIVLPALPWNRAAVAAPLHAADAAPRTPHTVR